MTYNQIRANRANALRSTGPKTEAGKTISSSNALKHGLNAKRLRLGADKAAEFEEMQAEYQQSLRPDGPLEQTLFDELVLAAWKLRTVCRLEHSDFPGMRPQQLAAHRAATERSFYKALRELKALQTESALRTLVTNGNPTLLPALAHPTPLANQAKNPLRFGPPETQQQPQQEQPQTADLPAETPLKSRAA